MAHLIPDVITLRALMGQSEIISIGPNQLLGPCSHKDPKNRHVHFSSKIYLKKFENELFRITYEPVCCSLVSKVLKRFNICCLASCNLLGAFCLYI